MSPDHRFPKKNYIKTNLLKQIKKISFTQMRLILLCRKYLFYFAMQRYNVFESSPSILA